MKKKIAFIIQHLTNGGAERTISNLSLELQDECDVTLIIFDGKNVTYPYGGKMIDLELPPREDLGALGKIINSCKRIHKISKIKKAEKFDCAVSFMFGGNIVNVLTKQREKVIISARNYMSAYGLKAKDIIRERFVASRADLEVALSKMVEHDLVENFGVSADKVLTVYNPVDVTKIRRMAAEECFEYPFNEDTYYFVTAGRIIKQKGQWHLLKAFRLFHQEVPNSRLIILSDGEMKQGLIDLAEQLKISDSVDFLGFLPNPYKYMARSSCFVLSSLFEGLGNVILEAMACEVPVISYDCLAGPRELIAPETPCYEKSACVTWYSCGVLVPPPDMNVNLTIKNEKCDIELAEAMLSVYHQRDNASECVKQASSRILDFSPDEIMKQWKAII